jgi:hypothetical protein
MHHSARHTYTPHLRPWMPLDVGSHASTTFGSVVPGISSSPFLTSSSMNQTDYSTHSTLIRSAVVKERILFLLFAAGNSSKRHALYISWLSVASYTLFFRLPIPTTQQNPFSYTASTFPPQYSTSDSPPALFTFMKYQQIARITTVALS